MSLVRSKIGARAVPPGTGAIGETAIDAFLQKSGHCGVLKSRTRRSLLGALTLQTPMRVIETLKRLSGSLRIAEGKAENGAVRAGMRFTVLAAAMLCLPPTALTQSAPRPHVIPPPEARVDINHATIEELLRVPSMSRSWAGRVVRFRPYRTKQDLVDRGVVTSQVYDRVKDYVIAHREKQ